MGARLLVRVRVGFSLPGVKHDLSARSHRMSSCDNPHHDNQMCLPSTQQEYDTMSCMTSMEIVILSLDVRLASTRLTLLLSMLPFCLLTQHSGKLPSTLGRLNRHVSSGINVTYV